MLKYLCFGAAFEIVEASWLLFVVFSLDPESALAACFYLGVAQTVNICWTIGVKPKQNDLPFFHNSDWDCAFWL